MIILVNKTIAQSPVPQTHFTLNGMLKNASERVVYLTSNLGAKPYKDSVQTDLKGRFTFTGQVKEPTVFSFRVKSKKSVINFFIENVSMTLTGDADSLEKVVIEGSNEQRAYRDFEDMRKKIYQSGNDIQMKFAKAINGKENSSLQDSATAAYNKTMDDVAYLVKTLVSNHPDRAVSIRMIETINKVNTVKLADSLLELVTKTSAGKYNAAEQLRKKINAVLAVSLGAYAPDFIQPDSSGKEIRLSSFKGKYVLIDFWASWCMPCRAENPNVLKAYQTFKSKNFTVFAVSLDTKKDLWIKAINEDKLPWAHVSDLKQDNEAAKIYKVWAIPSNYLIDPAGKIVAISLTGNDLQKKLAELLN